MGHDLRRMIRDGAPRSWTSLMRDVAKEIADAAFDPGQNGQPGRFAPSPIRVEGFREWNGVWRDGLVEICGATPRAISDALTELGRAGYEMRQPITDRFGRPVQDKRGRVVYAAKGHALRFCVPPLARRPEPQSSPDVASIDDEERSHSGASIEGQRSHPDVSKVAPECDPITLVTIKPKIFPTADASRLAEDQTHNPSQTPSQDPGRTTPQTPRGQLPSSADRAIDSRSNLRAGAEGDGNSCDSEAAPLKEGSVRKSQNRRLPDGSETVADDAPGDSPNDAESATTGTTRAANSLAPIDRLAS